jgi:hypothetical protein
VPNLGFRSGVAEDSVSLVYDNTSGGNWILTFRDKMMSTSSRSVGPTGSRLFIKRFSESIKESLGRNSLTVRLVMSYIYMEHLFLMFLDHTQRRSTVGRTPLDE